jgi:hypothetical protein
MKMNTLWKKRAVRIGLVVLGVLAVTVALVAMYLSTLVRWSMTPSGRFDPSASPAARRRSVCGPAHRPRGCLLHALVNP